LHPARRDSGERAFRGHQRCDDGLPPRSEWIPESGTAPAAGDPVHVLHPRIVAASVTCSKQLLVQSPQAEAIVVEDQTRYRSGTRNPRQVRGSNGARDRLAYADDNVVGSTRPALQIRGNEPRQTRADSGPMNTFNFHPGSLGHGGLTAAPPTARPGWRVTPGGHSIRMLRLKRTKKR
jgi:hypothetical protein